jgi:peptidoglycan/LPS O-acetylase OafA/YrhL
MKLNPPTWSLAVEVMFYALLPLIGWLAVRMPRRRRCQALIPLALLVLGVAYNWVIAGLDLGMTFSKTLAAMLPYFAVGMLAALALHGRTIRTATRRTLIAGGLALVLADATLKAAAPAHGVDATAVFSVIRDLPSALGFALVVGALAVAPRGRVIGGPVLVGMGTISYGFYLWHVPVLMVLRGHGLLPLDPALGTLVALVPALAVSVLSWFAIERPIIAWAGRRNQRAREEQRLAPVRARSGSGGVDRRAAGGGREVSTVRA